MKDFEEIYQLYYRDVYYFLLKMTEYNHALTEELTQETFYQAFAGLTKFRGECEIKTWICQIGRNVFYKHIRSEKNRLRLESVSDQPYQQDFSESIETVEKCRIIRAIIAQMDEPAKSVTEYRLFGEMSYSEIARLLKIREGTAKVIFYRAKVKIINQMREVYGDEKI